MYTVEDVAPVPVQDFLAKAVAYYYFRPREREPMWSLEAICRFFARRLRYSYESVMMMEESVRNSIFEPEYSDYLKDIKDLEKKSP